MGASSEGVDSNSKEIRNLLEFLFENYYQFFSKNERLNSDGIRLYKRISYYLYHIDNEAIINSYKKSFRDPTLENIIEFSKYFLDDLENLVKIGVFGELYSEKI